MRAHPNAARVLTLWHTDHSAEREGRNPRAPVVRRAASLVMLALGVYVVYRMAKNGEGLEAVRLVGRVGPLVAVVMAAPAVGHFVHMLGWRALLPASVRPSIGASYAIFIAAQAGNEIGFGLLGEPFKVTSLSRERRREKVVALVVDNLTAFVSALALWAALGAFLGGAVLANAATPAARALGATAHAAASVAAVVVPVPLALGIVAAAVRPVTFLGRLEAGVARAWAAVRTLGLAWRARPSAVLFATVAHFVGKAWIVAEMWLALFVLGQPSLRASAALGLAGSSAGFVGWAVPAQVGVTEALLMCAGSAVQVSATTVLALAVLRRVRSALWIALGAFCAAKRTAGAR